MFELNKVPGLHADICDSIVWDEDHKKIVQYLVMQYARLFGQALVDICKEFVASLLPQLSDQDVPHFFEVVLFFIVFTSFLVGSYCIFYQFAVLADLSMA